MVAVAHCKHLWSFSWENNENSSFGSKYNVHSLSNVSFTNLIPTLKASNLNPQKKKCRNINPRQMNNQIYAVFKRNGSKQFHNAEHSIFKWDHALTSSMNKNKVDKYTQILILNRKLPYKSSSPFLYDNLVHSYD